LICAACGQKPQQDKCEYCGKDPLLKGNYTVRLQEIVGKGAAGVTYRGMELGQQWPVAVKEMAVRTLTLPKQIELAHREAGVLAQLQHPAIPRYIDSLTTGTGKNKTLWLVTELVTGKTLKEEMESKRYDEDEVLDVLEELLGVLRYLHELSPPVVHRDLKPSNVMRRHPGNRIVLIDFGSVREALKDPDTVGSTVAGTFGYMAPEQFAGDASPKSDLYGLGALAVAMLSRQEPHKLHDSGGKIVWEGAVSARPSTRLLLSGLLQPEPTDRIDHQHARSLIKAARKETRTDAAPKAKPAPKPKTKSKAKKGEKRRPKSKHKPADAQQLQVQAQELAVTEEAEQTSLAWRNAAVFGVIAIGAGTFAAVALVGALVLLL